MKHDFRLQEYPWPKEGDKLFTDDGDIRYAIHIGARQGDLNSYADGYRKAAKIIIDNIDGGRFIRESLLYPIVFLYRHYVELRLKEIIQQSKLLGDDDPKYEKIHTLTDLWQTCKTALEKSCSSDYASMADTIKVVDEYIGQLAELDDGSTASRYPTQDGSTSLPTTMPRINMKSFSDAMERLANFLEAISDGIAAYMGLKKEISAEYAKGWE